MLAPRSTASPGYNEGMVRLPVLVLLLAAAAGSGTAQAPPELSLESLKKLAAPARPVPVRLDDQAADTVWFVAGDAEPFGTDGVYHPAKDVVVRKDASFIAGFATHLYGRTASDVASSSRPTLVRVDRPAVDASTVSAWADDVLAGSFRAVTGAPPAGGPFAFGSLSPSAARRLAATLALTGRSFTWSGSNPTEAERGWLMRLDPPVASVPVDAFPKARPPRALVRRNGRGATIQTTLAVFGTKNAETVVLPLRALGLSSKRHVVHDLLSGDRFTTDDAVLAVSVPQDDVRLLTAAPLDGKAHLLAFGDHLAGGLDFIRNLDIVDARISAVVERPGTHDVVWLAADGRTYAARLVAAADGGASSAIGSPLDTARTTSRPAPTAESAASSLRRAPGATVAPWSDGFRIDQSHNGLPLVLDGVPVASGLGAATGTRASIPLDGRPLRLAGRVGPAISLDETEIAIVGDGRVIWKSAIGGAAGSPRFDVALDGIRLLELRVDQVRPPATRPFAVTFTDLSTTPQSERR